MYKDFYHFIGKPELFKFKSRRTLEYADAFPLLYVKFYFDGLQSYDYVKHLLVDEMQDYTPVQYAVLSKLFKCKKTILGDSNQSVNPYSSTSITEIKKVFPAADTVELLKSYRSTYEITNFAQQLSDNDKLVPIERHGKEPQMTKCKSIQSEFEEIRKLSREFLNSDRNALGIICKTQAQADTIHQALKDLDDHVYLLSFDSDEFHEGIIITSAHMAKGLEFDQVIVPFVDESTYHTDLDKSLLYIACTRAMHKLDLTYSDKISPFFHGDNH